MKDLDEKCTALTAQLDALKRQWGPLKERLREELLKKDEQVGGSCDCKGPELPHEACAPLMPEMCVAVMPAMAIIIASWDAVVLSGQFCHLAACQVGTMPSNPGMELHKMLL